MSSQVLPPQLLSVVEQAVDGLCFYNTHVIDRDFRSHTRTALDTIEALQEEQRQRVAAQFDGATPTPEQLANSLDEIYRLDAQNIQASSDLKQPNVVEMMSATTAKLFKREMKVRIHEWEAAFREQHGRDAGPQDKAPLRGIYELYKVVKLKVQRGDGPATAPQPPPTEHPSQQRPTAGTAAKVEPVAPAASGAAVAKRPHSANVAPVSSTATTNNSNGAAAPSPGRPPPRVSEAGGAPSGTGAGGTGQVPHPPAGGEGGPNPAAGQVPSAAGGGGAAPSTNALTSAASADIAALVAEKKVLKRQLHAFEDEFRRLNGRQPTKEDRRAMGRDYHRYGELKALLAQHADE